MAEVTTTRKINPHQLCVEMGRVALNTVGPDDKGKTIVRADVPKATLENMIEAHQAKDDWVDPQPAPPSQGELDRKRAKELHDKPVWTPAEQQEATKLLLKRF